MKVRSRSKSAVPPSVVRRVRRDACYVFRLQVGGHLIPDKTDLAKYRRGNSRIRRIEERRDHKSRTGRSHLMNVVDELRILIVPEQFCDRLRLGEIHHEPITIVIMAGAV